MKKLLWMLALLASPAFAESKEPTHFVCGFSDNRSVSVQFGGGRFGDQVQLPLSAEELRPFLLANEQSLDVNLASLNGVLPYGNCQRGTLDSLVTCLPASPERAQSILGIRFTTSQEIAPNFWQTTQISRNVPTSGYSFAIKMRGEKAWLEVTLSASTPENPNLSLKWERELGPLNQGFGGCRFE